MILKEELIDRWMIDTAGEKHLMFLVNDSLFDLTVDQALAIRDSLSRHVDELTESDQEQEDPVKEDDYPSFTDLCDLDAQDAWDRVSSDYLCSTDSNMVSPATSNKQSTRHGNTDDEQLIEEWTKAGPITTVTDDAVVKNNFKTFQRQLKHKS